MNRSSPSTASLSILAPPADEDPITSAIVGEIVENFQDAGINAEAEFLPREEIFRNVLYNGDYEIFVSQLPPADDPDLLRGLLHSLYREEPGWQNPYRFAALPLDELLDSQHRRTEDRRKEEIHQIVETLCSEQPFTTIGYHSALRAVRDGRFTNWNVFEPHLPLAYYGLNKAPEFESDDEGDEEEDDGDEENDENDEVSLKIAVGDARVTRNFNPLAVEYRGLGTFVSLVYESLGYFNDGDFLPWLAQERSWHEDADETRVEISLPTNHQWHDGEPFTAQDVAFTYEFMLDTALGEREQSVPAPRFRVRASLVDSVSVIDETTVEISFGDSSQAAVMRALTVPILPEHIWEEQTGTADIAGIGGDETITEALVWENDEPIGSGPLQVEEIESYEGVKLVQFEDHFLFTDGVGIDEITPSLAFDVLEIETYPSYNVVVEAIKSGEADATAPVLPPGFIPTIEEAEDAITVHKREPGYLYHVGFNTASEPLSNPNFRQLVASLIDKSNLVDTIFEGHGHPVSNPFDGTDWTPEEYTYDDGDPVVSFIGTDGQVDADTARTLFRERGFEFDDDNNLILR